MGYTAYSLIKRFARDGGAILAVDVESHDIDHDVRLGVLADRTVTTADADRS